MHYKSRQNILMEARDNFLDITEQQLNRVAATTTTVKFDQLNTQPIMYSTLYNILEVFSM